MLRQGSVPALWPGEVWADCRAGGDSAAGARSPRDISLTGLVVDWPRGNLSWGNRLEDRRVVFPQAWTSSQRGDFLHGDSWISECPRKQGRYRRAF